MKDSTLSAAIAAVMVLAANSAEAQIALYDFRGTAAVLGAGSSVQTAGSGVLAMDLNTGSATYIGLITLGSGRSKQVYFQETPLENYVNFQIKGTRNQTFTVIAKAEAPGTQFAGVAMDQGSAIGLNSTLTIRTSPSKLDWILPKTLKSVGLAVTYNDTDSFLSQSTGTYTLNTKLTLQYNNADLGVSDYISFMRDYYTRKGISEIVLPPAE
jgi:hypothetical protein